MERAIWQNNEYYASEIMEDFDLETTIRNVSSRELFCPDPCCKKPLLKYCHGDIKDAYFAHLENDDCDYGNFDGRTSLSVKKVRRVLFEYFKALGYADTNLVFILNKFSVKNNSAYFPLFFQ